MPSIFQKDCPQCAAANELRSPTCACGYIFDSEDAGGADLQQEHLYRDYLAARVVQAEAELIVAREQLTVDPRNTYKGAQALLAEQALNTMRAQLEAHCLHAAIPKSAHKAAAVPPAKAAPAKASEPVKPAVAVAAATSVVPSAAPPAPVRSAPVAATPAPAAIKNKPMAPAPVGTAKPDEVFRRIQAAKAKAALRLRKTAAPKPKPAVAPAIPLKPAVAKVAAPSKQECPNCTAAVAADAKGCRCGYVFPTSAHEVPALALDANALAVLHEVLNPTPTRKPR